MRTSPAGVRLLKQCEGFRATIYRDAAGLPTIGYGHRLVPGESFPGPITEAEGESLLAADLARAEDAVMRLVTAALTQPQFDALVDFTFNLGAGRLAASTLLKHLNAGRTTEAAEQILRWDHCGHAEVAGLKARREAEFRLFSGLEPAVAAPTVAAPAAAA